MRTAIRGRARWGREAAGKAGQAGVSGGIDVIGSFITGLFCHLLRAPGSAVRRLSAVT